MNDVEYVKSQRYLPLLVAHRAVPSSYPIISLGPGLDIRRLE